MYDYYPFGLTFNSFTRSYSEPQRYKFNEYEVQDEIGTLLSQFRMYDPAIGRFWVQDPMVKENISPYAFANNNPILYMDALGLDTAKHPVLNIDRIAQMLDELKGNVVAQLNYIKSLVTSSDNSEGSDNSSEGSEEGEEGNDSYYETPSWMNGGFSITGPYMQGEGFGRRGGANGEFEIPRLPAWGFSNAGLLSTIGSLISGGMSALELRKWIDDNFPNGEVTMTADNTIVIDPQRVPVDSTMGR